MRCPDGSGSHTTEIRGLARAMMFKNAAAGLPHGGAKAGIVADPKTSNKEHLIRIFARVIECLHDYIPCPDMCANKSCMAYIFGKIKRSVVFQGNLAEYLSMRSEPPVSGLQNAQKLQKITQIWI
jgi:glutamate dehydrogenase/leucine dehydrogenase